MKAPDTAQDKENESESEEAVSVQSQAGDSASGPLGSSSGETGQASSETHQTDLVGIPEPSTLSEPVGSYGDVNRGESVAVVTDTKDHDHNSTTQGFSPALRMLLHV